MIYKMKIIQIVKITGKWAGYILLGILLIVGLIYVYSARQYKKNMGAAILVPPVNIEIPSDSASIAKGSHLFTVYNCRECHTDNLGGKVMIDDKILGYIKTSNLTKGKGGLPKDYNDQDWLRALKHGLNKDSKPLIAMPSDESSRIPDEDLADIIAYCKSVPPVDTDLGQQKIYPVAKILFAFGQLPIFSALNMNHEVNPIAKPEEVISEDFGATLTISCTGCHRENFAGGPPLAPGHPVVPDISSTGRPGKWTEEQFMNTIRTGITPEGHELKNESMPWKSYREYSDIELKSIRKYILTFPKETASVE
jgi:mono/diheme cytochrome c family protein